MLGIDGPRRSAPRARRGTAAIPAMALVLTIAGCTVDPGTGAGGPAPAPPTAPPPAQPPPPAPAPAPEPGPEPAPGLPHPDTELPALALVEVATLDAPIDTTVLPDGTVLVAERAGLVRVLDGPATDGVVLDVSDRTTTDGERGLLSIAVAPWGDELFLSLTDEDGDTLVEAHPIDGPRVTGPPRVIYTTPQPLANHNGGQILFLSDGTLVLGLGDGGGAGDPLGAGQDLSTPLGALVRLDVSGEDVAPPADNPFIGVDGAASEILASGLRNPWRMSLDGARDELWIADVGQSEREEINRIGVAELPGANFGWALREGDRAFLGAEPDDHVPPVHTYGHDPGCSVTGGLVYRGSALPELHGGYVFTDLCDGELRILLEDEQEISARDLGVAGTRIVGFGAGADGELLVLELGGQVLRLVRG